MFDPDNFENPLEFCAERFLKDGAFRNDPRVCIFSLGLRDCIAKKFAKEQSETLRFEMKKSRKNQTNTSTSYSTQLRKYFQNID